MCPGPIPGRMPEMYQVFSHLYAGVQSQQKAFHIGCSPAKVPEDLHA